MDALAGTKVEGSTGFKRVVIIEQPRRGMWCIGFVPRDSEYVDVYRIIFIHVPCGNVGQSIYLMMAIL